MLALAILAGCSAPVREQNKPPGQTAKVVPKPKVQRTPTAVIRGTLSLEPGNSPKGSNCKVEESVVFVEGAPKAKSPPTRISVGQTSKAFTPRVTMVAVGDSVVFVNRDHIYHSVFSISPARTFEIGTYGPGVQRAVGFDRRGSVRVFCDMHSATSGYIYVVPSRIAARPNPAGKWSLPPLPYGRYQLHVWHPELGERQWTVELTKKGLKKDLRF